MEEELQKLKSKLAVQEMVIKQSKRMTMVHGLDSNNGNRALEHKDKFSNSECLVETIN